MNKVNQILIMKSERKEKSFYFNVFTIWNKTMRLSLINIDI